MRKFNQHLPYWPYLAIWFAINVVQALTTELLHDEAYYWVYAQNLAWGYFDHPPAVGFLIFLTQWIPGELGVRLPAILMGVGILVFLFEWVKPKDRRLFFLFLCSVSLFHVGGFVMVPDIPMMAMSCLFLWHFEKYLQGNKLSSALILGLVCAGLMYSKYHGALLLIFAIIPNLMMLAKRKSFWVIPLISLLLFLPHVLWQLDNDFVTFRYHLFERGSRGFEWDFPLNYLYGQLLIYGPLMALVMIMSIRKWNFEQKWARTQVWIVAGVFGIFLLNSFRGRIEANWTAVAFPSLIYLSYRAVERSPALLKWTRRLLVPSLVIILAMRLLLAVEITTESKLRETHGWKNWSTEITRLAEGYTPVFRNSYQQAAKYSFYAGVPSFSLNEPDYKGNQYDYLMQAEQSLWGTSIALFNSTYNDYLESRYGSVAEPGIESYHLKKFDDFESYNFLELKLVDPPEAGPSGGEVELVMEWTNPHQIDIPEITDEVRIFFWWRSRELRISNWIDLGPPGFDELQNTYEQRAKFRLPKISGNIEYRIGLQWNETGGKNGRLYKLRIN